MIKIPILFTDFQDVSTGRRSSIIVITSCIFLSLCTLIERGGQDVSYDLRLILVLVAGYSVYLVFAVRPNLTPFLCSRHPLP